MTAPYLTDRRSALVETAFFVVLMAIAAATLWPIYQTPRLVVLAGVSLALGVILSWAGALLRWPGYVVFAAAVGAFLLFGVALAVPGQAIAGVLPSFAGVRELLSASALGWKQLVTVDLPVSSYQALLTPALVLLLGGTVLGVSVVLRTRHGALAVFVPLAVIVSAIALGPEVARYPAIVGTTTLVVSIVWMTWRARRARRRATELLADQTGADAPDRAVDGSDRRRGIRPVITAAVVLSIAVASGIAGAAALPPAGPRDVLRATVDRPFDPRVYSSPLSGFRSYWSTDAVDAPLFEVTGLPDGARIRLATLDTYNGVVYSVGDAGSDSASGFFARVPSSIDRAGETGTAVSAKVVVSGYTGVWLPTVGDALNVAFSGPRSSQLADKFYFNRTTGTAALLGGVREGDSYTLDAIIPPAPDDDELLGAAPGDASVPKPTGVPDAIATAVASDTDGLDSPGEKLEAVVQAIRASGYISHGVDDTRPYSRSGHAADRITELLTAPLMLGDAEQYATAVALMADEIGFPARVVLGFAPRAGSTTVTGSDVSAWVEVDIEGYGWVALDATPDDRAIPEQQPDDTRQVSRPQVVIPPPPAADDTPIEPNRPEVDERDTAPNDGFWPQVLGIVRIVAVVALGALVLAAPLIVVGTAKLVRRRRRRRRADASSRIAGGWQELVDQGLDYGYEAPATATRLEFARTVGAVDLETLARRADTAVFADEPVAGLSADEYWSDLARLRATWAREYTRWERVRAAARIRSLTTRGSPSSRPDTSGRGGARRG